MSLGGGHFAGDRHSIASQHLLLLNQAHCFQPKDAKVASGRFSRRADVTVIFNM